MRAVIRVGFALLLVTSCVSQAKQALAPEPEGGGTLSCKEIVEQCDSQCSDPLCLHRCTPQGTEEARGQHDALLECGQRNSCSDQDCMEQNCSAEIQTCMGPAETPSQPEAPTDGGSQSSQQESS
jgi:hypothetical protein